MMPAMLASTSSRPNGSTAACDRPGDRGLVAHVGDVGWMRPWSLAVTSRPCSSTSTASDRGPLLGQSHRGRATDARPGAGDDGDLPFEPFQRHGTRLEHVPVLCSGRARRAQNRYGRRPRGGSPRERSATAGWPGARWGRAEDLDQRVGGGVGGGEVAVPAAVAPVQAVGGNGARRSSVTVADHGSQLDHDDRSWWRHGRPSSARHPHERSSAGSGRNGGSDPAGARRRGPGRPRRGCGARDG